MKNRILLILAGMIVLCATSSGKAESKQTYRATGMATIHNNYVDIARDKAIDNALRNLVERVAGVMVTGSTEVENFQLKMDRILSESKGFIEGYQIVSEQRQGDTYEVTVEAEVGKGKLQDRLKASDLIINRKYKPRLMVIFGETAQKDSIAETAMTKIFLGKGFKLIDASIARKNRGELSAVVSSTDDKALANLVRAYGAEVIIAGSIEAATNPFTVSGVEMFSNKVDICVKVINADTGDVITTGTESLSRPGPKGDMRGITETAAKKLANRIMDETLEHWSGELTNSTTVKLRVSGLGGYEDLLDFKDQLPLAVKGFKDLYQRAYAQGAVELDLEVKGDVQGVADDLSALIAKGRKLTILSITQNMISATFLP